MIWQMLLPFLPMQTSSSLSLAIQPKKKASLSQEILHWGKRCLPMRAMPHTA
jgi:hypothetical protein